MICPPSGSARSPGSSRPRCQLPTRLPRRTCPAWERRCWLPSDASLAPRLSGPVSRPASGRRSGPAHRRAARRPLADARHDVDTEVDLATAIGLGVGPSHRGVDRSAHRPARSLPAVTATGWTDDHGDRLPSPRPAAGSCSRDMPWRRAAARIGPVNGCTLSPPPSACCHAWLVISTVPQLFLAAFLGRLDFLDGHCSWAPAWRRRRTPSGRSRPGTAELQLLRPSCAHRSGGCVPCGPSGGLFRTPRTR